MLCGKLHCINVFKFNLRILKYTRRYTTLGRSQMRASSFHVGLYQPFFYKIAWLTLGLHDPPTFMPPFHFHALLGMRSRWHALLTTQPFDREPGSLTLGLHDPPAFMPPFRLHALLGMRSERDAI